MGTYRVHRLNKRTRTIEHIYLGKFTHEADARAAAIDRARQQRKPHAIIYVFNDSLGRPVSEHVATVDQHDMTEAEAAERKATIDRLTAEGYTPLLIWHHIEHGTPLPNLA